MHIYSIYDMKSKDFGLPFFSLNNETAQRQFRDLSDDPSTTVYKYPDDFTLFEIGSFDREKGTITALEKPQTVVNALEIQTPKLHAA